MSLEKLKRRVNPHVTFPRGQRFTVPDEDIKNALPEEFDSRQRWPVEFAGIRDQGDCGSCWAFAITTVVADRDAIKGSPRGHLSAQDLVSCDTNDYGCGGSEIRVPVSDTRIPINYHIILRGCPFYGFKYMKKTQIVEE
ncbi:putative cathepsin B2 cysteine protease [Blattamonas nauphoetae]|uniref:Cathepsin B2 cysteine protease n=1 Tax=Blattamonas nauphoetae TaxID=2049346 RepID=A0ABQ9XR86_9EUKA|nr:putative cathepsin B2 cysteine protease [Blattamonas nauphoetae]